MSVTLDRHVFPFTAIVGQAPGRYQSDLQRITLMVG